MRPCPLSLLVVEIFFPRRAPPRSALAAAVAFSRARLYDTSAAGDFAPIFAGECERPAVTKFKFDRPRCTLPPREDYPRFAVSLPPVSIRRLAAWIESPLAAIIGASSGTRNSKHGTPAPARTRRVLGVGFSRGSRRSFLLGRRSASFRAACPPRIEARFAERSSATNFLPPPRGFYYALEAIDDACLSFAGDRECIPRASAPIGARSGHHLSSGWCFAR